MTLLAVCMGYAWLLNLDYATVEAPIFGYTGLVLDPPPRMFVSLGYLMAAVPVLWLPLELRAPSQVAYWWLYVVVVVPLMFVPYHVLGGSWEVLPLPGMIIGLFALLGSFYWVPQIRIPVVHLDSRTFTIGWATVAVVSAVFLAVVVGFRFELPTDVYELRMSARETTPNASLAAYVAALTQRCIAPVSLAIGIGSRRPLFVVLGLAAALSTFGLAGEKTLLASPVFMLVIGALCVWFRRSFGLVLIVILMAVLATNIYEYAVLDGGVLSAYGPRRVLFVPAHLTSYYWQYYSENPHAFFSNGIVARLFATGDILTPSETIGLAYFGTPDMNANANMWASGFADMGYLGMVLVTVAAGGIFRFIDSLAQPLTFLTASLIMGAIGIVWAEGAFQTSLLSAGVVPTVIVFYLYSSAMAQRAPLFSRTTRGYHPAVMAPPIRRQ